ncbi:MAG: glycosyltransferase [Desulfuromonadales bacterium]|nr:glycosyltransferase [Desulfuromonadales bacterium]
MVQKYDDMKILCVLGKHQYGVPSRGLGIEYDSFIPALRSLGHEVIHFESLDKSYYANFIELNRSLIHIVEEERPDIMLTVQMHYEIWIETLQIIREEFDVATVSWTTDDSWKFREVSRFIGKYYQAMTTTYPDMIQEYHRDGIQHVMLTQWAATSNALLEPLAAKSCRYQLTFIGAAHGDRADRVSKLRSLGLEVTCFGYGWPLGPVSADAIPNIMRDSVISLNFSNSKGANQIKARTFEVPGAGGFLLTENAPGLDRYYLSGKEIVTYDSLEDLVQKAKYYLSHPCERDAIALAGFQRTVKEHTYEMRLKDVLDFTCESHKRLKHIHREHSVVQFDKVAEKHRVTLPLKLLRFLLVMPCTLIWGEKRGPRAARRLLFEFCWRFTGEKTFSSAGWPGRLFYVES